MSMQGEVGYVMITMMMIMMMTMMMMIMTMISISKINLPLNSLVDAVHGFPSTSVPLLLGGVALGK